MITALTPAFADDRYGTTVASSGRPVWRGGTGDGRIAEIDIGAAGVVRPGG
jgi:hypothetical protein